jgi:hypothetical protein
VVTERKSRGVVSFSAGAAEEGAASMGGFGGSVHSSAFAQ